MCRMRVQKSTDENQFFWILGDSFLTSHYTIFDNTERKIGFVQNQFVRVYEPVPEVVVDHTITIVIIVLAVLFVIIILAIIIWRICVCLNNRKQTSPPSNQQTTSDVAQTERDLMSNDKNPDPVDSQAKLT